MKPLLLAACDAAYFEQFGSAFCKSALIHGHEVLVHIVNPGPDFTPPQHPRLRITTEVGAPEAREYYAARRFQIAPDILSTLPEAAGGLLILDIDSIVRGPIEAPEAEVGLFRRPANTSIDEWTARGTRVAAGVVYYAPSALPFARQVAERISQLPAVWFADQVALAEAADDMAQTLSFVDIAETAFFFDFHLFDVRSLIWSGKGKRKYERSAYLKEAESWSLASAFTGDPPVASPASAPARRLVGPSARRVVIAKPRLDCSFKPGPVPETPGPPLNRTLRLFERLIDQLAEAHTSLGHRVEIDERPLWCFDLEEMQQAARGVDRLYFPHKQAQQFPIGENAWFYKNAAFPEWLTVDPNGWGASMSWAPLEPAPPDVQAWKRFHKLKRRIEDNRSLFDQPPAKAVAEPGYLLFVCQLPHDETIQLHSKVGVAEALAAVLDYGQATGQRVLVKGHPAGRKVMGPLRTMTEARPGASWVEEASIHACLAGASTVYLVNSGVGFEAMLHEKPIIRFGEAEYGAVVPRADPSIEGLAALRDWRPSLDAYVGFIADFRSRCLVLGEASSAVELLDF